VPRDRDDLLRLYRARVAAYDVDEAFRADWSGWCRTLLAHGGDLVVPPRDPEPNLAELRSAATPATGAVRHVDGDASECHGNTAALWIRAEADAIGTGYALSDDGLWRQHSWGVDADGTVVETTERRVAYVGVVLTDPADAVMFALANNDPAVRAGLTVGGGVTRRLHDALVAARDRAQLST
jgi:hypothetical protein